MTKTNTTPKRKDTLLRKTVQGRLLSGHIFTRYWIQIFAILIMVLVYITNRYTCQAYMGEIRSLTSRLEVIETESMRVRGRYMSRIRESSMRQRLDSLGLPLSVQMQPPYHISSSNGQEK